MIEILSKRGLCKTYVSDDLRATLTLSLLYRIITTIFCNRSVGERLREFCQKIEKNRRKALTDEGLRRMGFTRNAIF